MHHRTDAGSRQTGQPDAILPLYIFHQISVTSLEPFPHLVHIISPDMVHIPVFPVVTSRGNGRLVLIDQDSLDPRRSQLDPEHCFSRFDPLSDLFSFSHPERLLFLFPSALALYSLFLLYGLFIHNAARRPEICPGIRVRGAALFQLSDPGLQHTLPEFFPALCA